MSFSWSLIGPLSFVANTPFTPAKYNWIANTTSDPALSSAMNSAFMPGSPNANGNISFPYSGLFIIYVSIDTNEFQISTGTTGLFSITYANANATINYTLGSMPLSSGNKSVSYFKQCIQINRGDTLIPIFNFNSSFNLQLSSTPYLNTGMCIQDITVSNQPIFWQGSGAGTSVPNWVSVAPRFMIFNGSLTSTLGKITFYLTNTGTPSGLTMFPLGIGFSAFSARAAVASSTTAASIASPFATEDSRAPDNTWMTANVLSNATSGVLLGGTVNGLNVAPVGTLVQLLVIGW